MVALAVAVALAIVFGGATLYLWRENKELRAKLDAAQDEADSAAIALGGKEKWRSMTL